ncbi:MAG: hypothetical protein WC209_08710 [Ignavibacteriaceae bacterium]|jgi:hypothetical protein
MGFLEEYNRYSEVMSKTISDLTTIQSDNFIERFKKHNEFLSERTKIALKTLGKYGWFIPTLDHYVSYPSDLAQELNNNNEKYVDEEMMRVLKSNFKEISKNILKKNPNRVNILQQAFEAHKSKKYALSVPVFLSQADGICKEVTTYGLFFKNKKLPKTKAYVDTLNKDSFFISYLEPLRIVLPIIFSDKYLDEDVKFNRHKILHGEDFTYGNELISLKAFSLLSYINTFLHYE